MVLVPTKLHISFLDVEACTSRRQTYGVVAYSHVERNLAVGEVNSVPYKIEMDLPKIFKEAGQGQLN
jgi:hypothetical protein